MTLILSGTDGVSDIDGTAATPAIRGTDANTGIFFPAADTIAFAEGGAEAMRIDSSGNVGIGTTAPSSALEVYLADTTYVRARENLTNKTVGYQIVANGGTPTAVFSSNTATGEVRLGGIATNYFQTFYTSNAERMRIDSSGRVLVGTSTSPNAGSVGQYAWVFNSGNTTGSNQAGIYAIARGEAATSITSGEDIGFLTFTDSAGNDFAYIRCQADANAGSGDYPGRLIFATAADGSSTVTERARITSGGYFKASNSGSYVGSTGSYHELVNDNSGNVVLALESTNANFDSAVCFIGAQRNTTNNSFYFIDCYNRTAAAYKFKVADSGNVTNTNGSYGTISDVKLKQDIVDAGSQWDDIKNLRFRKYRLKSEVELDTNAKTFLGLVAQEAELVSPGLIEEHKDTKQETKTREVEKTREIPAVLDEEGNEVEPARTETYTETEEYTETVDLGTTTKSIKTSILYMKAVKALQEAMTRIEALEAQNAAFEARLAALEAK